MARDYLACSGSSAAPERTFSAAADVCSSSRGSLIALTIQRLVSTRMWLAERVPLGDKFFKVTEAVGHWMKDSLLL